MKYTICIRNLDKDVDAANLCATFGKYGRILSASIEYDDNFFSLGKAYVCFDNLASGTKAMKVMNGTYELGNPIRVSLDGNLNDLSKDDKADRYFSKIFVKNFSLDWDDLDLLKKFREFGDIEDVHVANDESGKLLGYGYVVFKKPSAAKAAVEALHGKVINDKRLIVEPFIPKNKRSPEVVEESPSHELNNLHVKNLPKNMTDEGLSDLFGQYGPIVSTKIARDHMQNSRGFGFVCFVKEKDAATAREKMNNCTYNNKILEVNFNMKKAVRQQLLQEKFSNPVQNANSKKSNKGSVFTFSAKR